MQGGTGWRVRQLEAAQSLEPLVVVFSLCTGLVRLARRVGCLGGELVARLLRDDHLAAVRQGRHSRRRIDRRPHVLHSPRQRIADVARVPGVYAHAHPEATIDHPLAVVVAAVPELLGGAWVGEQRRGPVHGEQGALDVGAPAEGVVRAGEHHAEGALARVALAARAGLVAAVPRDQRPHEVVVGQWRRAWPSRRAPRARPPA